MEQTVSFVAVLFCILLATAVSKRIQGTIITLPMLYTVMGLILSGRILGLINLDLNNEIIVFIAEVTLVLLLATDVSLLFFTPSLSWKKTYPTKP